MSIIHQEARASGAGRRKNSSASKPSSAQRKGSRKRKQQSRIQIFSDKSWLGRQLSDWPGMAVLAGGIMIAVAYAYLFYYFFIGPSGFRWKAMYGEPPYPDGYNIRGIDISHYQERVDWERLCNARIKDDPIRFVFIKATEGEELFDSNFNENFYQARRNGLIRGAYHFFIPDRDPVKQADFFLRKVHLEAGDLPPVLDVEKNGKLSSIELSKAVKQWLDIVENHYNVKPILYTSYKFKKKYLNDPGFDEYPYWIAHYYVNQLQYKGKWHFWQHTDRGRVDGIENNVDFNIFNGSLQELMQMTLEENK